MRIECDLEMIYRVLNCTKSVQEVKIEIVRQWEAELEIA